MLQVAKEWWKIDEYDQQIHFHPEILKTAGPKGIGVVRMLGDAKTEAGWGMSNPDPKKRFDYTYPTGRLSIDRFKAIAKDTAAYALVMRSVSLVCIDIDGKNGGLEHARELIAGAPPTLAEKSRSGTGYHLFYSVEDEWTDEGFQVIRDRIGIVQGVDIRGIGCVYHHAHQRWNDRPIAPLPQHLVEKLKEHKHQLEREAKIVKDLLENKSDEERLEYQQKLISDLGHRILEGGRNQKLFAIGARMCMINLPGWEKMIRDRAIEVGLSAKEANSIVRNIPKYGDAFIDAEGV